MCLRVGHHGTMIMKMDESVAGAEAEVDREVVDEGIMTAAELQIPDGVAGQVHIVLLETHVMVLNILYFLLSLFGHRLLFYIINF